MARIMGIDTGGTFTDGVIVDPLAKKVLCKSKVFTLKQDLVSSIDDCIGNLLLHNTGKVSLVCLSTTLATNAIVEGKSGRVGLLLIGGRPEGQLPADICIELQGKINIKGKETEGIDEDEVLLAMERLKGRVDAVAISGYASVRNPAHELQVKKILREKAELPLVCAHELSSRLGYYERTVTAALNAGLVQLIGNLIGAVKTVLKNNDINAPVMIVKGDGSLMMESLAMEKPIETILSGPAASVIGALYLTDQKEAFVLDMGGTTTDTAIVTDGSMKIRETGAIIGGWSPQIRAADIRTFGIGGDSRIGISSAGEINIGPRKVVPLCAAGNQFPNLIRELETANSDAGEPSEAGTDCFALLRMPQNIGLSKLEKRIIHILKDGAHSLFLIAGILDKKPEELDMEGLESRDIIQRMALTPTDVLHVAGGYRVWNEEISKIGTAILAKKMNKTIPEFLDMVSSQITDQIFDACREGISDIDRRKLAGEDFFRERPLVAIGAPVKAWLPAVSQKLHASLLIPEHAEVANAIGAAVGLIVETAEALIRPRKETQGFALHSPWEYRYFITLSEAIDYTVPAVSKYVQEMAERAGSEGIEVSVSREDIYIDDFNGSSKIYIETRISATATGYPK